MSSSTYTPACRSVRHRRRSNVTSSSLTPKPIDSDHITFRSVKNDDDEEVGKEVVYEPLEVDPNLSRWSDFVTSPIPNARAYCGMTIHAVYLLRLKPTMDLYRYFIRQRNVIQRFDRIILNLSIDVLMDGKIQYNPPGTPPSTSIHSCCTICSMVLQLIERNFPLRNNLKNSTRASQFGWPLRSAIDSSTW